MEQGVKSEERRVKNSSAPSTSSASSAAYADQVDAVEVKAGGRTYRFAKKDGRLMGVEVGSKAISLSNGPRFMAARRSDRSLDQFYNHDDKEAEKKRHSIPSLLTRALCRFRMEGSGGKAGGYISAWLTR